VARGRAAIDHLRQAEAMIRQRGNKAIAPFHRLVSEVQLRALSAVIETGGFSPAARRLGLSQPSVHRAARELETLCGCPLWRRSGAGVEATQEARELSRHAGLCFNELQAAIEDIREIRGLIDGHLNVGALPLARSKWLPQALAKTLKTYPAARVRVIDGPYDEQLTALRHGRIDMILGALRDPVPTSDIVQTPLFEDPWLIVVRTGHPLTPGFDSETDRLAPVQLDALSWILPRDGTPGRDTFERFMAAKALPPPTRVVECASFMTIRALLLETDHAAIVSRQQVEADVALGQLKIMGPPLAQSFRTIGLTLRRDFRPTQLQQAFIDEAKAFIGEVKGRAG
jgi:DNA-binding transcriptional LysR family regulator